MQNVICTFHKVNTISCYMKPSKQAADLWNIVKLIAKYVFTISYCKDHRFAEHIETNNKLIKERERERKDMICFSLNALWLNWIKISFDCSQWIEEQARFAKKSVFQQRISLSFMIQKQNIQLYFFIPHNKNLCWRRIKLKFNMYVAVLSVWI